VVYQGVVVPTGIITITTPGDVVLDVPGGFTVQVDVGILGTLTLLNDPALTVGGGLVITSGTVTSADDLDLVLPTLVIESAGRLDVGSHRLALIDSLTPTAPAPTIAIEGELAVGAGGNLALEASVVDVLAGGTLRLVGASDASRAAITGAATPTLPGGWSVELAAGSTLEANLFQVQQMGTAGIDVDIGAALGAAPLDLRDGVFDLVAANGVFLEIERGTLAQLEDLVFKDTNGVGRANQPGTKNVRVSPLVVGSKPVSFGGWRGAFGGSAYEDDEILPTDNFALWGSRLAYLNVREHATQHDVFWRTLSEDDTVRFEVERAPLVGAFGFIGSTPAVGPSVYVVADTTITPATPYRYRLREVLFDDGFTILSKIAQTVTIDGIPGPGTLPGGNQNQPPAPLIGRGGPGGWKLGKLAGPRLPADLGGSATEGGGLALDEVIASALLQDGERWIEIELPAGRHSAFTFEPLGRRHLRIIGHEADPAAVDVSEGPIVIRGLEAESTVELSNFALASGASRRPALVIEDCQGLVVLDRLEVRGTGTSGIRVVNSRAVVLQGVALPDLARAELTSSSVWCRGGRLNDLVLAEGSQVESWGTRARGELDPRSRWTRHAAAKAQLALESLPGELLVTVEGDPGALWRGFAGQHLVHELPLGAAPVLIENPLGMGTPRQLGPDGKDQLVLAVPPVLALLARPLYLQAVLEGPEHAAPTPVRSFRAATGGD
jgi:hypothetical protein